MTSLPQAQSASQAQTAAERSNDTAPGLNSWLYSDCAHRYAHQQCRFTAGAGLLTVKALVTSGRLPALVVEILSPCCRARVHYRAEPTLARCSSCSTPYTRPQGRSYAMSVARSGSVTMVSTETSLVQEDLVAAFEDQEPLALLAHWAEWSGHDVLSAAIVAHAVWERALEETVYGV